MPISKHKLTQQDFDLFKAECEKWLDFFGLKSWDVVYGRLDKDGVWAEATSHPEGHTASIYLARTIGKDVANIFDHSKLAFHEVCEIFLVEFESLIHRR